MSPGSQARHASPQSRRDRWAAAGLAALAIAVDPDQDWKAF